MAAVGGHLLSRLQQAQEALQSNRPRRPSSAVDHFTNDLKKHYKLKEEQTNTPEFVRLINEAWQSLAPSDKQRYENRARADMARYLEEERLFDERQMEYSLLHKAAVDAGLIPGQPQQMQGPAFMGQMQRMPQPAPMVSPFPGAALPAAAYSSPTFVGPALIAPPHPAQFMAPQQAQQAFFQQQQFLMQQQAAHEAQIRAQQAQQQQQQQRMTSTTQRQAGHAGQQVPQPGHQHDGRGQHGLGVKQEAGEEPRHHQQRPHHQRHYQAAASPQEEALLREDDRQGDGYPPRPSKRPAVDHGGASVAQQAQQQSYAGHVVQQHMAGQPPRYSGRPIEFQGQAAALARPGSAPSEGGLPSAQRLRPPTDIPEKVEVMCQGVHGTMIIREQRVMCHCSECQKKPQEKRVMSCTQFEAHAGAGSAKKWKTSLKVRPGAEPEVPPSSNGMQVGKWLELRGIEVGKPVFRAPPGHYMEVSKDSQARPAPEKTYASERLQRLQQQQRYRRQDSSSGSSEGEEEEAAAAFAMLAGGPTPSPAIKAEPAGHHLFHHHQQVQAGQMAGAAPGLPAQLKLEGSLAGGITAEQLGKRLPGRPPKDGVYKPERLAALYGVKLDKLPDKVQTSEPWNEVLRGNYVPIRVRWAGERCSVCDADTDYDFDQLVTCDLCGITVHQSCYGVPELPDQGDMWLCRACELKEEGKPAPQCCLCPVAGGALKPTTIPGLWCHAACLQWIPEVTVEDATVMEPVDGVKTIQAERWNLLCGVCKQRMGAKIQCQACYTAYHPLCGRIAGLHMEIKDGPDGPEGPIQLVSYCPRHCTPQPQLSGCRLVKESEEQGDLPDPPDAPQLWNGQPFQLAPSAPLPDCCKGCARAQPLVKWVRQTHGTGTGATTEEAFWIPETPPNPPPPRQLQPSQPPRAQPRAGAVAGPPATAAAAAAAAPSDSALLDGSGRSNHQAAAPPPDGFPLLALGQQPGGGGRGGGRGGRGGRGAGRGGRSSGSPAGEARDRDKGPPPKVELAELPEGVEETVPVQCNGRHARLVLRTQRVVYDGQEMPPSKFEAICGKADAKKWKSSLWFEDASGQPVKMMQDWLAERNLDRKALDALTRNALQYQQYIDWQDSQADEAGDTTLANSMEGSETAVAAGATPATAAAEEGASPRGSTGEQHRQQQQADPSTSLQDPGRHSESGGAGEEELQSEGGGLPPGSEGVDPRGEDDSPVRRAPPTAPAQPLTSAEERGAAQLSPENAAAGEDAAREAAAARVRPEAPGWGPQPAQLDPASAAPLLATTTRGGSRSLGGYSGDGEAPYEEEEGEEMATTSAQLQPGRGMGAGGGQQPGMLEEVDDAEATAVDHAEQAGVRDGRGGLVAAPTGGLDGRSPPLAVPDLSLAAAAYKGSSPWRKQSSPGPVGRQPSEPEKETPNGARRVRSASLHRSASWGASGSGERASMPAALRMFAHAAGGAAQPSQSQDSPQGPANGRLPSQQHQQQLDSSVGAAALDERPGPSDGHQQDRMGEQAEQDHQQQQQQSLHNPQQQGGSIDAVDESVAEVLIQLVETPTMPRPPSQSDLAQQAQHAQQDGGGGSGGELGKRSRRLAAKRLLRGQDTEDSESDWASDGGGGGGGRARRQRLTAAPAVAHTNALHLQQRGHAADAGLVSGVPAAEVAGRWVRLWWPDDEEWYEGEVREYKPATGQHRIWYPQDGQEEWIDLEREGRNQRVQLLPGPDKTHWPPPPPPPPEPQAPAPTTAGAAAQQPAVGAAALAPRGAAAVGRRVGIWWEGDGCFYYARVEEHRPDTGRYLLRYDDGDTDWVNLDQERLDWGGGLVVGPIAGPRPDVPESVDIVCNQLRGTFHVKRSFIILPNGQEMTPTEFERQAGRAAAKKWKTSLRIDKGGGVPGITVQDWLIRVGVDAPKQPRPSRATLDTVRRRQISSMYRMQPPSAASQQAGHGAAASGASPLGQQPLQVQGSSPGHRATAAGSARGVGLSAGLRGGKQGHREGCTCVICKQARRTGKPWAGQQSPGAAAVAMPPAVLGPAAPGPAAAVHAAPASEARWGPAAARSGGPGGLRRWRAGKRAYLQALPQVVGGLGVHQTELYRVPLSRCWTPQDWVVHRWRQTLRQDASQDKAAADAPPGGAAGAAAAAAAQATAAALAAQQHLLSAIGAAFGGGGGAVVDSAAPEVSLGYGTSSRRALTVKEKVDLCNATERERIAFGKSGIHGWGLFARVPVKQDSMVIEYRGDLLRRPVADLREAAYRSQGKDCYLFNLDDDLVIDATQAGNIARFTNHCCNPSLYTKILNINGDLRLMFFARFDLQVGQELTYNYRFKAEEGEERLPCNCGAPNCTGFLN